MKKDIRKLERIHRAATKLPESLRDFTYEERLERLDLTTLERRREREDLIMMYILQEGLENLDRDDLIVRDDGGTIGNSKKLKNISYRRDVKKYSFPHRGITTWNGLDEEIGCAKSIHEFKDKLDKKTLWRQDSTSLVWILSCISQLSKYN